MDEGVTNIDDVDFDEGIMDVASSIEMVEDNTQSPGEYSEKLTEPQVDGATQESKESTMEEKEEKIADSEIKTSPPSKH